jgi:hypothetical protein
MLGEFILELVVAPGSGQFITLPGVAPAGRLTWGSQFPLPGPVFYMLDDTVQQEWGVGSIAPGPPWVISRDRVIGNSAGTLNRLNFAGITRCYPSWPAPAIEAALGANTERNLFRNPLFNISQRGPGPFTPTAYGLTLDMWATELTNGTRTITQAALSDADRAAIGDEEAEVCMARTFAGTGAVADFECFEQNIEFARRVAGKQYTVSFWAIATVAGLKIGVGSVMLCGAGGSVVATAATPVTLSTVWQRYIVTMQAPTAQGLTFGTPGTDMFRIRFWISSGANNNGLAGGIGVQSGNFRVWGMQCELGVFATPLEKIDRRLDFANCQRYLQVHNAVIICGYQAASSFFYSDFALQVPMRAVPTVINSNTTFNNGSTLGVTIFTSQTNVQFSMATAAAGMAYCTFNTQLGAEF